MPDTKLEPILKYLGFFMIFFTVVLVGVEYFFKEDAQVFQVIAGILTGITGACLARIKPPQGATGATGATGADATGPTVTTTASVTTKVPAPEI